MITNEFECVAPSEQELAQPIKHACPQQPCKSIFTNSGQLRLHLVKHHKIAASSPNTQPLQRRFYCPRPTCKYHLSSTLHFRSMQLLRQHFLKVHADKHLECPSCPCRFASQSLLNAHSTQCGRTFQCATCNWTYESHESLTTHCRRKKHQMPPSDAMQKPVKPLALQQSSKTTQTIQSVDSDAASTVFLDSWHKRAQTQSTLVQTSCSNPVTNVDLYNIDSDVESNGFATNNCSVQTDINLNDLNTMFENSFSYEDYCRNYCHIETQTDCLLGGAPASTDNHITLSPMAYADIHTQTQCDEFLFGWSGRNEPTDFSDLLSCAETQTMDIDTRPATKTTQTHLRGFANDECEDT